MGKVNERGKLRREREEREGVGEVRNDEHKLLYQTCTGSDGERGVFVIEDGVRELREFEERMVEESFFLVCYGRANHQLKSVPSKPFLHKVVVVGKEREALLQTIQKLFF